MSVSDQNAMKHASPFATYVEALTEWLHEVPGIPQQNVRRWPHSSIATLMAKLPEIAMPCAVIVYLGSNWKYGSPRRQASIGVVVAQAENPRTAEKGQETVVELAEAVIEHLDEQLSAKAVIQVVSDDLLEVSSSTSAILIKFEVKDV